MVFQAFELTEEDILGIHRYFITHLYLQDKKTDAEIVQHLYEQHKLKVTLSQIQKCIVDWNLELSVSSGFNTEEIEEPDTPSDDGWVVIPSTTAPPGPASTLYTPSDPKLMSLYTERPLPSLPTSNSSIKTDLGSRVLRRQTPNADRIRGICHHGIGSSDSHEVETTLSSVPTGPSQIKLYVDDDQDYERVAQGLKSVSYPRAGHYKEGLPRHQISHKISKRPKDTSKAKRDTAKSKEKEPQRDSSNEQSERD